MNIAVGSAFRNSGPNAVRYLERVAALRDLMRDDHVRVIAIEGDSTDNTRDALLRGAEYLSLDLDLRTCNHGGPVYASTEEPARMQALSKVGSAIFDGVRPEAVALLYVESDLLWDAWVAKRLIHHAIERAGGFDVFSPMVMAGRAFYDIWGFRTLDGRRFSSLAPFVSPDYHQDGLVSGYLFEVGSVGSCLAMRGDVARACRIQNDSCLVGWCEDARSRGYRIAVDPDLTVRQL